MNMWLAIVCVCVGWPVLTIPGGLLIGRFMAGPDEVDVARLGCRSLALPPPGDDVVTAVVLAPAGAIADAGATA